MPPVQYSIQSLHGSVVPNQHAARLGLLPYVLFRFTLARRIANERTEEIKRLLLWAPLNFLFYYAATWILAGLIGLVIKDEAIFSFLFGWIDFVLYIFPVGYFFIFLK